MFANIKLRWFVLPSLLAALFLIAIPPVVSWAGELEDRQEAVRQNPNDALAHFNLGLTYLVLERYEDAIAPLKEAIRIQPDYAAAHFGLGIAYRKSGQHQEAIASYKEAIRIKPDFADAHWGLGYVYNELGQYQEAIASYKEALRIKPNLTVARNLLNKLEQK